MANQLHKYGLKVTGYKFLCGEAAIAGLKINSRRRYIPGVPVAFDVYTNQGTLHVELDGGFEFDGRSGPWIIDWYAPNLGTMAERICWLAHDANAYGQDLNFNDTNLLLYAMLRDLARYNDTKATVIRTAVSLSKGWYGTPKKNDWCYKNINKVSTMWVPAKV